MQQQLINLDPQLSRLSNEGYELEVKGGYLCVHHIPYVNHRKEVKTGTLVSELNLATATTLGQPVHTMYFEGEAPCHKDGTVMHEIINSSATQQLAAGVVINHYFSSKPSIGYYSSYYEKITRYISIISAPARSIDPDVTAQTYKAVPDHAENSVFNYIDTNSSRANIVQLNERFKSQKVAIIGLGGTGSYILDMVAKTPVKEIHLFDGDDFSPHNAFRSPGAPSMEELNQRQKKATYLANIYSKMHKGVVPHIAYVTGNNIQQLQGFSFVFISIDNNKARNIIVSALVKMAIPFIDVGLGVSIADSSLIGIVRTTTSTSGKHDHLENRLPVEETGQNEYVTNIQIADLNNLNATFAVIKWKKLNGFYQDLRKEHHSTYSINVAQLLNGDTTA